MMEYMEGGALTHVIENNTLEDQIAITCLEVSIDPQALRALKAAGLANLDDDRRLARASATFTVSRSSTATSSPTTSFSTLTAMSRSVPPFSVPRP